MKRKNTESDTPKKKPKQNTILPLYIKKNCIVASMDEVGLGCILGPAFCAAVILPDDFVVPLGIVIKDSKQMNEKQKLAAEEYIKEHALEWTVQSVDEETIDRINILKAKIHCWHQCLDALKTKFNYIIVDGNQFSEYKKNGKTIKHETVVKGDNTYLQIAAASILAKTARDRYIRQLATDYPELQTRYQIFSNVGYYTGAHKEGLEKFSISQFHRKSPLPCKKYNTLNPVKRAEELPKENEDEQEECENPQESNQIQDEYDISDICFV